MGDMLRGAGSDSEPIRAIERNFSGGVPHLPSHQARSSDTQPSAYSRRAFLRLGASAALAGLAWSMFRAEFAQAGGPVYCNPNRPSTPAEALAALLAGNALWASGNQQHPGEDATRRACVATYGQTPFAAMLSCADSRVPPALVFDQGLGDLFVVRVAGNSNALVAEQSLAYGVKKLGALVLFVLGHEDCGAVKAAVASYPHPAEHFVRLIYPAVRKARSIVKRNGGNPDDPKEVVPVAIEQHVIQTAAQLRAREPFRSAVVHNQLQIAGGVYSLDNQTVTTVTQ